MLKFRCQHCGGRIAVGARHLGKLVTCPECGRPTHPLAEQIVSLTTPAPAPPAAAPAPIPAPAPTPAPSPTPAAAPPIVVPEPAPAPPAVVCDNCGQPIGTLQKRYPWNEHLVCSLCLARLSGESSSLAPIQTRQEPRSALIPAPRAEADDRPAGPATDALWRSAIAAGRLAAAGAGALTRLAVPDSASREVVVEAEPTDVDDRESRAVGRRRPAAILLDAPGRDVLMRAPLPMRTRMLILLAVVFAAGAAVYGALTLLRDLAGYITSGALILLAAAVVFLLARAGLSAGRRLLPLRAPRERR